MNDEQRAMRCCDYYHATINDAQVPRYYVGPKRRHRRYHEAWVCRGHLSLAVEQLLMHAPLEVVVLDRPRPSDVGV